MKWYTDGYDAKDRDPNVMTRNNLAGLPEEGTLQYRSETNFQPVAARPRFGDEPVANVDTLVRDSDLIYGMVAASEGTRTLISEVERFAPYPTTVLIQGESGTGKEVVARTLHKLSAVLNGPYVVFSCSNLVEQLAESQLFGHVRGAFTDAREQTPGFFRAADGGTLFLDEIGDLPLSLQPKLLRVLESHEVHPVGAARGFRVNVRVVAATNRPLLQMVQRGEFRADLYYRLNAATIAVPTLRDRVADIRPLVGHFFNQSSSQFNKRITHVTEESLSVLERYAWPGNIRELRHAVDYAALSTRTQIVGLEHFPAIVSGTPDPVLAGSPKVVRLVSSNGAVQAVDSYKLQDALDKASRRALILALRESDGNCARAAQLLGVSRYTVYRMVARYGLDSRPRYAPGDAVRKAVAGSAL